MVAVAVAAAASAAAVVVDRQWDSEEMERKIYKLKSKISASRYPLKYIIF